MSHEIAHSVPVQHPQQPPRGMAPGREGRCAHVIKCSCGVKIEGRGDTKKAARKRAEINYRQHVKETSKARLEVEP